MTATDTRVCVTSEVSADVQAVQELAAGLRAVAAFVEANPRLAKEIRFSLRELSVMANGKESLAEFARAGAATGAKIKKTYPHDGNYMDVVIPFGAITMKAWASRAEVCERVVTGTETVTKTVKDPDAVAALPDVEVTEEVETFRWVCSPLLADDEPAVSR